MRRRLRAVFQALPQAEFKIARALRESFRKGYSLADLRADVLAGLVVGVVALPLSMALAVASGVPPQHGLYTAIIAGGLVALTGGSPVQVAGPTAAFVVILAPIAAKFGLGGLLVATMIAGALLLSMGLARLGRLIEFIPHPVTAGFTAGIAVVIATLQLKDFLGLRIEHMPEHYIERVWALWRAIPTLRVPDVTVGLLTLGLLVFLPKLTRRVPAPIVALPLAAVVGVMLGHLLPGFHAETINDRFSYVIDGITHAGIPRSPPMFTLPWNSAGPDGRPLALSFGLLRELISSAFAIAMLGAIESLLSAVVADGMTGGKHDPDAELIGQGVGNLVAPLFGGIAATGAIARTATNIRSGARSPLASLTHAVFVLAAVLVLAPALGYLPMSALAALLLLVAWNMSEIKHVGHTLRVAPRSDVLVLLTCLSLTIVFDMVVSVTVGIVLASLLFMQRMATVANVKLLGESHPTLPEPLPKGVLLYEIGGPLFFGAAQKAMSALRTVEDSVRVVVLDLSNVPVMDATGLVSLESSLDRLHRARVMVIIGGVQRQPLHLMARAGWKHREWVSVYRSLKDALALARDAGEVAAHLRSSLF